MSLLVRRQSSPYFPRRKPPILSRFLIIVSVLSIGLVTLTVSPVLALNKENKQSGVSKASKTDPITQAKNNVAQAQKEASEAATKYSNAYGALSKINDELADTQSRLDAAESSISTLQEKATKNAKDAYIRSSAENDNKSYEEVVNDSRRDEFLSTVSEFDDGQLTSYVSMKEDLEISRDELAALQKDRKETLNELSEQKKALETKLANASKAQKDLELKAAKDAKARKAAAKKNTSKSSTAPGTIINPGGGAMACPVQGALAFTNDWGQPRSGGRTHKGNDLFSPRGTPNVAVVDGRISFANEGTGGISAYLAGSNGITYYYTHLNDTVGSPRSVSRGEVIGHTGSTGNARGGATHTHFEIRQGGTKVNPYSTLRSIC